MESKHLDKLNELLSYELSSSVLLILSFQYHLTLYLATFAAILFAPYMLYVLFKENKNGWIITFIIMVLLPLFATVIIVDLEMIQSIFLHILLGVFYLYCFLLKYVVKDWLKERLNKIEYLRKKMAKKNEEYSSQLIKK